MNTPKAKPRRVLGIVAIGLFVTLISAPLFLGWWAFFTEAGTRCAAEIVLKWYDGSVNGSASVGSISGRLCDRLILKDIILRDRSGSSLIEASELEIAWSPLFLLDGCIFMNRVALRGAKIRIDNELTGNRFLDLTMKNDDLISLGEGMGPDLPFVLRANLTLEQVELLGVGGDQVDQPWAYLSMLDLSLVAAGKQIRVDVRHASGDVPGLGIASIDTRFDAHWDGSVVALTNCRTMTDFGSISIGIAGFDVKQRVGFVGAFVEPDVGALSEYSKVAFEREFGIVLTAGGSFENLRISIALLHGPDVTIEVDVKGSVRPNLDVLAEVSAYPVSLNETGDEPSWGSGGEGSVRISGTIPNELSVEGNIICRECWAPPMGRFDLTFDAGLKHGFGDVTAKLAIAETRSVLEGHFEKGEILSACVSANIDDLSFPASLLGGVLDLPSAAGSLALDTDCDRKSGVLVCRGNVRGRNLHVGKSTVVRAHLLFTVGPLEPNVTFEGRLDARGVRVGTQRLDRIKADVAGTDREFDVSLKAYMPGRDFLTSAAAVDLGDGVRISLHQLNGRYRGSGANLARPATFSYRESELEVRDFKMRIGGGHVFANGVVSRREKTDLTVRVSKVRLDGLSELVLGSRIAGKVSFLLRIDGTPERPEARLRGVARRLSFGGQELGTLRLQAEYRESRFSMDGGIETDGVEVAKWRAKLPFGIDLWNPMARLLEHNPLEVRIETRDFDLSRLVPLIHGVELTGKVNALLVVGGTSRDPRGELTVAGKNLVGNGHQLGDAKLFASFSRDHMYVDFANYGGSAKSVNLTAKLEIAGSPLIMRTIRLARAGDNNVRLKVEGLRLDELRDFMPKIPLEGTADGEFSLSGSPDCPYGYLDVSTSNLNVAGVESGPVQIVAEHSKGVVTAVGRVEGGMAKLTEVGASLPIRIALERAPKWLRDEYHELDLSISGLEFAELRKILELYGLKIKGIPLDGSVDCTAVASGTALVPHIDATLISERLSWDNQLVGATAVSIELVRGEAELSASIIQGESRWATLVASAPYNFALNPPRFRWNEKGAHSVELDAHGIDKVVFAPFLKVPEDVDFRFDMKMAGEGSAEDFKLWGEWGGKILASDFSTLPFRGKLNADFRQQVVELEVGTQEEPVANVKALSEIPLDEFLSGTGSVKDARIEADLRVPGLDLQRLAVWLPNEFFGLSGKLSGELLMSGTLGTPVYGGRVMITDGAVTVVELGQRVRDIELSAVMTGRRMDITDLRFRSGPGTGTAQGEIVFGEDGFFRGSLKVDLRQFPLVKPGLPYLSIWTRAGLNFLHSQSSSEAVVTLRDSRVRLDSRQRLRVPKTLPEMDKLTFVDPDQTVSDPPKVKKNSEKSEGFEQMRLVIDVMDSVEITGTDVDMRWSGRVQAISSQNGNDVIGRIEANRGRFWLLNNTFSIETGEVSLSTRGELDPYIHLIASADTPEALVTVLIKGKLSRPELTLSSDPSMSQYQILTLLLTGRSDTGEGGEDSDEVRAQAASLLMAFNNPSLERQINDRLGVDRVGVSMGQSINEPVLSVGKRFGRHFYVETEYHHNAPPTENRAAERVEYYIDPHWSLETFYGDANKGGIEIFWRNRFGRSAPMRSSVPDESGDDEKTVQPSAIGGENDAGPAADGL